MNISITYSSRVRMSDNIEIRVEYKKRDARKLSNITMVRKYVDNGTYEKRFNKIYVFLLNFYILTKQNNKANRLLDNLLVKAKGRLP